MSQSAEYMIAQYFQNPFRREPRNVGVIVVLDDASAALFIGEMGDTGEIDGRSTKWIAHPKVYRKWVKYWREQISKGTGSLAKRLMDANGNNYSIISGGAVTDFGLDSPQTICANLFSLLVSHDDASAINAVAAVPDLDNISQARALEAEIASTFRQRHIMSGHAPPTVKHPIWHNMLISGKRTSHTPQFSQRNGKLFVMESVNFLTPQKTPAKHHAGYVAKMFDDIADYDQSAERIAIVRASPEDLEEDSVKYSLALLEGSARIVKWLDAESRNSFVDERERIALSNGPDVLPGFGD